MERLTDRNVDGSAFYKDCFSSDAPCNCGILSNGCAGCEMAQKQCDELAAYEDLSDRWKQSIEQMDTVFRRVNALGGTDLMAQYEAIGTIDDLTTLVKARDEGRVVVLPCRVGGTVYIIIHGIVEETKVRTFFVGHPSYNRGEPDPRYEMIRVENYDIPLKNFGKTVFLTRAEAEAALEGESDGN